MKSLASFAESAKLTPRRLRKLAQQGRIKGAILIAGTYFVPSDVLIILPPTGRKDVD